MQLQKKILCYMQLHLGHDFYNIFKIRHNLYSLEVSPPSPNKKKIWVRASL